METTPNTGDSEWSPRPGTAATQSAKERGSVTRRNRRRPAFTPASPPCQLPGWLLRVTDPRSQPNASRRLRLITSFQPVQEALENQQAVIAAQQGFTGPFGMGHQPCHVARVVAHPGNVLH